MIVGRATGESGQGIVEYGIILVLVGLLVFIALVFFGKELGAILAWVGSLLP